MKGGALEVLLVSAEDLKNPHILGSLSHYAIIQCGNQQFESKITSEVDNKVWWNEKFRFILSPSECKEVPKLKVTIMDKDKIMEDCFLGETTVHLNEIVEEGCCKGFVEIKPSSYNVVLEDGSYEGELKLGLKFISNVELEEKMCCSMRDAPKEKPKSIYRVSFGDHDFGQQCSARAINGVGIALPIPDFVILRDSSYP
ncbi:hypothetical protein LUZ60_016780 [Juncus effusus]|nr:hypothetical protein LUZ60_016780 [Juncus effusus]